jgi:hypothetical protein
MFKNSVGEIYLPNENRRRRLKIFEIIAIAVCVCEEEDIIINGEEKRDGCCERMGFVPVGDLLWRATYLYSDIWTPLVILFLHYQTRPFFS